MATPSAARAHSREGDAAVAVDEGLDLAGLLDDVVEQLGEGAEVAGDGLLGHGHGGDTSNLTNRQTSAGQAPSRWRSRTPDGVPPPEVTTAVRASATWRSPASWRSWVMAS